MADPYLIDRRTLMAGAILLVGGTLAGFPGEVLAQSAGAPRFFTPDEFALLEEISGIVIPRTDTPGAREAGVPGFIDALMADWASAERQGQFRALLAEIDAQAGGLLALPEAARIEAIRAHDAAAFAAPGGTWRKFKELVVTAYYLSEPGATQELRYELSPGVWEAAVPVGPDTRAWAV
jgi:gluconate 2-dehydrogenase gamma chain